MINSVNNRIVRVLPSLSLELSSLIFLDIETSGLYPMKGADITEIAVLSRNKTLFYWKRQNNSPDELTSIIMKELLLILKKGVVVGHNCRFDLGFISYEAEKKGLVGPEIQYIDTLALARKYSRLSSNKLESLLKYYDIEVTGTLHTAITDAQAVRALFWKLVEAGNLETAGQAGVKQLNWSTF